VLLKAVLLSHVAYEIVHFPLSSAHSRVREARHVYMPPSAGGWLMAGLMLPKVSCVSLRCRQCKRSETPWFWFYRSLSRCKAKIFFLGFSSWLAPQQMPVLWVFVWHGRAWHVVKQKDALAVCVGSSFVRPWPWQRFRGAPAYRADDAIRKEMPCSELWKDGELGKSRVGSVLGRPWAMKKAGLC